MLVISAVPAGARRDVRVLKKVVRGTCSRTRVETIKSWRGRGREVGAVKGSRCSKLSWMFGREFARGVSLERARASMPALKSRPVMDMDVVDGQGCVMRWAVLRPVPQPRSRREMLELEEEEVVVASWVSRSGSSLLSSSESMDWSMLPSVS